jgi:hypothetical protein
MKYYSLEHSSDSKVIGKSAYPQTEGVYTHIDNPQYFFNAFKENTKIDRVVEFPMAKIRRKSVKLTDLLSGSGYGFEKRLLISNKLKLVLDNTHFIGFQFFETKVFDFQMIQQYSYWLSNVYLFFPEYVDYSKSELWTDTFDGKGEERVFCDSYEEYQHKGNLYAPRKIYLRKVEFIESQIEHDFFALNNVYGAMSYYVSERLKEAIESAGCTGMKFIKPDEGYP